MFYVYILVNPKNKIYIGQTKDLNERLVGHKTGKTTYTRSKGPWRLLHSETYQTRNEALKREKQLKGGQGREWIKKTFEVNLRQTGCGPAA
ncbi:MAG: GIY-YIG nuclease family protein [bacterium]|nr:GIY-YIG nuclease family protein [bacterium]